jgi:hypothetical protein
LNPIYEGFLSILVKEKEKTKITTQLKIIKNNHYDYNNKSIFNQSHEIIYFNFNAFFEEYTKKIDFNKPQNEYNRHIMAHGRLYINDDQLQAIKTFANLYNMAVFFIPHVEEINKKQLKVKGCFDGF